MHRRRSGSRAIPGGTVGHRGWLGVRLDRALTWDEIAGVIEDAYLTVAPKR